MGSGVGMRVGDGEGVGGGCDAGELLELGSAAVTVVADSGEIMF